MPSSPNSFTRMQLAYGLNWFNVVIPLAEHGAATTILNHKSRTNARIYARGGMRRSPKGGSI
jgi:hypothetical protein